jgi:HEAT repeat protein
MPDETSPLETAMDIVNKKEYPLSSRLNAILYMVEKFHTEALPLLENILANNTHELDIRSAAALSIGRIGGERAFDVLSALTQEEEDDQAVLKNAALQGLGLLGNASAIPFFMQALESPNNTIFYSAAEALGKLGRPALPHLITLLETHPKEDIRCVAAWQLGSLQYAEALPSLLKVMRESQNTDLLALCVWALGEIGIQDEDVLATLKEARRSLNPAISERAARALKKIARHVN